MITLIEFTVENYKIFKDKAIFSMATRKPLEKTERFSYDFSNERLLNAALLYGPNAAGKSSFLEAFSILRNFVTGSYVIFSEFDSIELPYFPYAFGGQGKPTVLSMTFGLIHNGESRIYEYTIAYVENKIVDERLLISADNNEMILFDRKNRKCDEQFSGHPKEINEMLWGIINNTESKSALNFWNEFSIEHAMVVSKAISEGLKTISGANKSAYRQDTVKKFKENIRFKAWALEYLQKADFQISNGKVEEETFERRNGVAGKILNLIFEHKAPGNGLKNSKTVEFPITLESLGTQSFFALLGPVYDVLNDGGVLCVDELDTSLHPSLTRFIVDLFNSDGDNPKHAQIVVTTHDVSLIMKRDGGVGIIRDEIWFFDRVRNDGGAVLYPLSSYREKANDSKLRNDTEYACKYLEGRFGALPYVAMDNI